MCCINDEIKDARNVILSGVRQMVTIHPVVKNPTPARVQITVAIAERIRDFELLDGVTIRKATPADGYRYAAHTALSAHEQLRRVAFTMALAKEAERRSLSFLGDLPNDTIEALSRKHL